jgi:hypothetical protein
MSFNFFLNNAVVLNQNTAIFTQNQTIFNLATHYRFAVDCSGTLNTLFLNRSYTQNTQDENDYNVNLTVDTSGVHNLFNANATQALTNGGAPAVAVGGTAESGNVRLYIRLLEIMALQVFGHAKARAAIANDADFINRHANIVNHLNTEFASTAVQNDFFEQYVQVDRAELNTNDINSTHVNFNLRNSAIGLVAFLNGTLVDGGKSTTDGNLTTFQSGPGNDLINADNTYNISVLITLNGVSAA